MNLGVVCIEGGFSVLQFTPGVQVGHPNHLHDLVVNAYINTGSLMLLEENTSVFLRGKSSQADEPFLVAIANLSNDLGGIFTDKSEVARVINEPVTISGLLLIPYVTLESLRLRIDEYTR